MSASGLLKDMTASATKDSFSDKAATFCSTVAKNGETFFEYMSQPEHSDMALKANGVVPWLNVRSSW